MFYRLASIKNKLDQEWPSLFKNQFPILANSKLWFDEWAAHGTCSFKYFNFFQYFDVSIKIYERIKINDILQKEGIIPGQEYDKYNIVNAIARTIQFQPQIRCEEFQNLSYLLEVRICFTASKDPQYKDCDTPFSNCGAKYVSL